MLHPNRNLVFNLAGLPSALMDGAAVDQDTNCRIIGRCSHGRRWIGRSGFDSEGRAGGTRFPEQDLDAPSVCPL